MGLKGVKKALKLHRQFRRMWRKGVSIDIILSEMMMLNSKEKESLVFFVKDVMPDLISIGYGCRTPREFYIRFRKQPMEMLLKSPKMQGIFLRMDIKDWVPSEKAMCQAERSEAYSKSNTKEDNDDVDEDGDTKGGPPKEPYPIGCTVRDDAIVGPNGESIAFDVKRFMVSRDMRPAVFEYLERCMQNDHQWPAHTNLMFEWRTTGPRTLQKSCDNNQMVWSEMLEDCHNYLGESDPAVVFWILKILESYPHNKCHIMLHTKDTDTLPLCAKHFWNLKDDELDIYWIHAPDEYVHMREFIGMLKAPVELESLVKDQKADSLKEQVRWSPELFTAACIISGCDYYKKHWTTDRIGHEGIWNWMQFILPWITEPLNTMAGFSQLIRSIWGKYYKCSALTSAAPSYQWLREQTSDKQKKQSKSRSTSLSRSRSATSRVAGGCPSSDTDLEMAFKWFKFTFEYWITLHESHRQEQIKKKQAGPLAMLALGTPIAMHD